ncbi:hypothetical protein [Ketogulonicigenium vulgare]|uniref:hypothetical protein n=1 Tax=Ketogulonicigenium vulgare TaxID=92945 RepID=UPI00235887AB|nr:hypothetical protein [Ketogulonicigenium vulgare]
MKKIALALALAAPLPAFAQQFTGAELSAELSYTTGSDVFGATSYTGAMEFQVAGPFSVAGDFSFNGYRAIDSNARNFTVHGIYDTGYDIMGGVFVGFDSFDSSDSTVYGVEGKFNMAGASLQGFLGYAEGDRDIKMFGFDGDFSISPEIAVTGIAAYGTRDDDDLARVGFGGEYRFAQGPVAYGEIGRISNDDGSENYLTVGARVALGYTPGTSFSRRGIADIFRGY